MIEIEPTVENVQPGDVVTIETGTPGVPGHESGTYWATSEWSNRGAERSLYTLRALTRMGWRITRITRRGVRVTEKSAAADLARRLQAWANHKPEGGEK